MAKLILKVNYYKPGRSKSMGGYAKYVATRENVEKLKDETLLLKATDQQEELIEKLTKDSLVLQKGMLTRSYARAK